MLKNKKRLVTSLVIVLTTIYMFPLAIVAQTWTASTLSEGAFYLYNVESQRFLCSGGNWGSQAMLSESNGFPFVLKVSGEGYTIASSYYYDFDNHYLDSNGYVDGSATVWTFEEVDAAQRTYRLKTANNYLCGNGSTSEPCSTILTTDIENAQSTWKLVAREDLIANLVNATSESPINATFLMDNPYFALTNNMTKNLQPKFWLGTNPTQYNGAASGTLHDNFCVEHYQCTFDQYQTLSVPNGLYRLQAQGFYRGNVRPLLYANEETTGLIHIDSDGATAKPNDIASAGTALTIGSGYYRTQPLEVSVTDGTLRLGVKSEVAVDWCAFDNFNLSCLETYFSASAQALPNNSEAELEPYTWYYFDVKSAGNYTLNSNHIKDIQYTTNAAQSSSNVSTLTATSLMVLQKGRIYLRATSSATTLEITSSSPKEETSYTFTVAAMNVDGLPPEILGISINPDAKEEAGATAIGQKLSTKGYDFIGLSEDFNYHESLVAPLEGIYSVGTHRGQVTATGSITAFLGDGFDTDGLGFLWKENISATDESWTMWNVRNGKTSNGSDELIRKGYRHYTVTIEENVVLDVFQLHMDAETDDADIAARESQMAQLAADILQNYNNGHPKIVMGDYNCRYTRDYLKEKFIDVLAADGTYEVNDAWIEYCRKGSYPTYGTDALMVGTLGYETGEIVDKILYLNPTANSSTKLKLNWFKVDTDFNDEDGTPLADHYPVTANFTATQSTVSETPLDKWTWKGETVSAADTYYIYNVYFAGFIKSSNGYLLKNPNDVSIWELTGSGSSYSFACQDGSTARLNISGLKYGSGATTFTLQESETTTGAYKLTTQLWNKTRYFNANNAAGDYSSNGATTSSKQNDWLFISKAQKTAFDAYSTAYETALLYLTKLPLNHTESEKITSLLGQNTDWLGTLTQALEDQNAHIETWFSDQSERITSKSLSQNITSQTLFNLPAGYYLVSGLVTPSENNAVTICLGNQTIGSTSSTQTITNIIYWEGGDCTLAASSEGDFTISGIGLQKYDYYYEISLSNKSLDENTHQYFNTLCLPYNTIVPSDVTIWYATKINTETVHLEAFTHGTILSANTPIVVSANEANTYFFLRTETAADLTNPSDNLLYGTPSSRLESTEKEVDIIYYVLANKSKGVGFYPLSAATAIPQYKAYLKTPSSSSAKQLLFDFSDEANAIRMLSSIHDGNAAKPIAVYSASGSRLSVPQRGLNILRMSDGSTRKILIR